MKLLTTSELASLFSISKHTIRHYIDIELLTPKERKENGYFFFDEEISTNSIRFSFLKILGTRFVPSKPFCPNQTWHLFLLKPNKRSKKRSMNY